MSTKDEAATYPYFWYFREPRRRKGKPCRIVVSARRGSDFCTIEFQDGEQIRATRRAIRKRPTAAA